MWEHLAERAKGVKQSSIRAVTKRIEAVGGVNLGQGTCALEPREEIKKAAQAALEHHNSYAFFDGVTPLKEAVAARYSSYNHLPITADQVLITGGATGGLECVCKCFLEPGDEVILFEPIYEYHIKLAEERGAIPRFVSLEYPAWSLDPERLRRAFSKQTKLLVFANPNNPTGKVFTRSELCMIGEECKRHGAVAVVDEVYEYILSPGYSHISLASIEEFRSNTITLSSASKTLFVTGWRVGWMIAPNDVIGPLGVKSDETYVCAPTPLQYGVAEGLKLGDDFFSGIKGKFDPRRTKLEEALKASGLRPLSPQGAYYILADYSSLGFTDDVSATEAFIEHVGVAAVPGNSFYRTKPNSGFLRFCFAVTDVELSRACDRLKGKTMAGKL